MRTAKSSSKFSMLVVLALMFCRRHARSPARRPIPRTAAMRCRRRAMACSGSIPEPARFRPATIRARAGPATPFPTNARRWTRKSAGCKPTLSGCRPRMKVQGATRRARAHGPRQDRGAAAEIGFAEEERAEGSRGRAQDRNPAAERPRHGSHDVVPRAGLAAIDRDGQPGAEGRQRQDLTAVADGAARVLRDPITSAVRCCKGINSDRPKNESPRSIGPLRTQGRRVERLIVTSPNVSRTLPRP